MSKPEQSRKHALECLRLEADCMQLAGDAIGNSVRQNFIRTARVWSSLALLEPGADDGRALANGKMQTT